MSKYSMSSHQCEIAAESLSAALLSQAGYDVFVQYGPRQQGYDMIAEKRNKLLKISVKGSQNGGWALAIRKKGMSYHESIELWLKKQDKKAVFFLVQFEKVCLGECARVYVAKSHDIAKHMMKQCGGLGYGALKEGIHRKPRLHSDQIPKDWIFSQHRIDSMTNLI